VNTLPIWLATGLYIWQAANFAASGATPMALVFLGYSVANLGLIWAAK
jgi:hypothetical protein